MLLVSNAIFSGVAPLAPGLSTESVFLPLYSGEPSSRREMVVPINSTWLISSVPTPCSRSLYGLDVASPRKLMLWNRYCIIVRISPNWPPRPSCSALAAAGSGSSTTISLMSCWVCKYISLLESLSYMRRQSAFTVVVSAISRPGRWVYRFAPCRRCQQANRCHRECGPARRRERSWPDRRPELRDLPGC